MSYSVGQVSAFAGVTVRTLHHYDKAGLLAPSGRSRTGYRLYSDADLTRLQQILFYRELGITLDEIAAILKDPQANALEHLRARQRQLSEEITRLRQLSDVAERAIEVQETGVTLTPQERFEVFGEITFDLSYATQAELKWAHSEGQREAMARAASLGVYLQPTAPTGDFPPVITSSRSLGRPVNRTTGRFALRMADRVYEHAVAMLRHRLQLPPASASAMRRRQEQANWPILHGFSTALVPRPSDWRSGLQVVGTWWPHLGAAERLPTDLEDFLRTGPRPVLIGFGSMGAGDGERLSEIAVRALRRAGLRGILQAGSAGLAADGDDVLTIGDLPHALLLPRLAALVHHAGAGTSAAALRAGVPAVTVPVTADQPFWAGRLAALGAATEPIPFRSLTAERLADSLDRVVRQQTYTRAAARAARHMVTEDGAGQALNAIQLLARR